MSNTKRKNVIAAIVNAGYTETITRQELLGICEKENFNYPHWIKNYQEGRGTFSVKKLLSEKPSNDETSDDNMDENEISDVTIVSMDESQAFVPKKFEGYVPFGHFNDIKSIIKSNKFYPTYVTGLSGNGKTIMIEEICARLGREMVRTNITIETDEDDLIGGFRLVNGETRWTDGPVINAMQRGAILLLDEVDLGSHKMMCLQPILEGKPIYIKKINKVVYPSAGFNIFATANTKGRGSEDGKFVGTMIMNEAFLERFSVTFEQEYPANNVEQEIMNKVMEKNGIKEQGHFVKCLADWASAIRASYQQGSITEMISTRRLVHICEAFAIFGKQTKALELCLNRFDPDTKKSFQSIYEKIDEKIRTEAKEEAKKEEMRRRSEEIGKQLDANQKNVGVKASSTLSSAFPF